MKEKQTIQKLKNKADGYLNELEGLEIQAATTAKLIEDELKKINEKYAGAVAATAEQIKKAEKNLKAFVKKNNADLFGKKDQISLPHGIILYTEGDRVTIPRNALDTIEKLGWKKGYIETKKIDRDEIEGWSDEELTAIGASRKPDVNVSWELTNVKKEGDKP